jgi:NADH-quinone oxidoreductase subunit N
MVGGAQVLTVPVPQLAVWRPELVLVATVLASLAGLVWPRARLQPVVTAGLALATGLAATSIAAAAVAPLGPHFVVDGPAALVRLVVVSLALVVQLVWRPRDARAGGMLALAALGCSLLGEAATLAGLLTAVAAAVLGGGLAAWFASARAGRVASAQWLATAGLGFGILVFAGTLWCGVAGTLELAAVPAALADRPSLPPLVLPILLSLTAAGLALALLGEPGRFRPEGDHDPHPLLAAWLTAAPPLALAVLLQRLVGGVEPVAFLAVVPPLAVCFAALLMGVGFVAALAQDRLSRRLAWAALGQVGLALMGYASPMKAAAIGTPVTMLLAMAPAHLGAMLLAEPPGRASGGSRWREPQLMILSALLISLAALPPLAGWRPRLELFAGFQAGEQRTALVVAAAGALLAVVVYLRPVIDLWREAPADGDATSRAPGWAPAVPTLLAAALLAGVLCWGLGLLDPAAGLS